MSERLPLPDDPTTLAAQLVHELRATHPGIVEEWERQRTDAMAAGEDDWPDTESARGALWWLESEVTLAKSFMRDDPTGREQVIAAYCTGAAEQLRAAIRRQVHGTSNYDLDILASSAPCVTY
jgi:hypothetical protein